MRKIIMAKCIHEIREESEKKDGWIQWDVSQILKAVSRSTQKCDQENKREQALMDFYNNKKKE